MMSFDYPEAGRSRKPASLARREMDALLTQNWEERLTFMGDQVSELMRTVRGFNGTPGLTQKMERVELTLEQIAPQVAELHLHMLAEQARAEAAAKLRAEADPPKPKHEQTLTQGGLALVVLVFAAGIVGDVIKWLLTDFFPNLFKHLP